MYCTVPGQPVLYSTCSPLGRGYVLYCTCEAIKTVIQCDVNHRRVYEVTYLCTYLRLAKGSRRGKKVVNSSRVRYGTRKQSKSCLPAFDSI